MGYMLGILGTITLVLGVISFGTQTGMLFWVMTAVFYSGEGIVRAIDKLRIERKPTQ